MQDKFIVFGDVAGQYDALEKLLKQIPKDDSKRLLSVGDMIDRGPKPIEVVDFFKNNGEALHGNHENMFVDYYENTHRYDNGLWTYNGGDVTKEAYDKNPDKLKEHLPWIKKLPLYIETDEFFISHGIWSGFSELEHALQPFESTPSGHRGAHNLYWNRDNLIKRDKFQIYGHNGLISRTPYSICIDSQRDGHLAAYDTDTKKIYRASF